VNRPKREGPGRKDPGVAGRMRFEIILPPDLPPHPRQTVERCGLEVVPLGAGFRVKVGTVLLRADEAVVRLEPDAPRAQTPQGPE